MHGCVLVTKALSTLKEALTKVNSRRRKKSYVSSTKRYCCKCFIRMVGKLIFLSLTRLNITFSVSVVSQCIYAFTKRHMDSVNQILRFLKGRGLLLKKNKSKDIVGYFDASYMKEQETIYNCLK